MRYIACDIGEKRVGIAVSDASGKVASPVKVLPAHEVIQLAPSFRRLIEDYEPECLVCGLPKTLSGDEGPQAQAIKEVATALAQRLKLDLVFVDERLSSSEAKRILREQGMSEKDMRGHVDKIAASLILQMFLDRQAELE